MQSANCAFFTIHGRPVSKKNNSRIVRFGGRYSLLPSKAYSKYEKESLSELKGLPYCFKDSYIEVACRYWLPDHRWFPDLTNLLNATDDILEKSGIIDNDKHVVSHDGSYIMGFDKANPRVDISIRVLKDFKYLEVTDEQQKIVKR